MKTNNEIFSERIALFGARQGPRVGDYLRIPPADSRIPEYTRFAYEWDDTMQTGGSMNGSYYLGNSGALSYSGGLDPGIKKSDLLECSSEVKAGKVWFFDGDISGAGRGVAYGHLFRVFTPRPGANLGGLNHLRCPYYLNTLDERAHKNTCGYWYTVTKHATSHAAFRTEEELFSWLKSERLTLTHDLPPIGTLSGQALSFDKEEGTP